MGESGRASDTMVVTGLGVSGAGGEDVAAFTRVLRGAGVPVTQRQAGRVAPWHVAAMGEGDLGSLDDRLGPARAAAVRRAGRRAPAAALVALLAAIEAWLMAGLSLDAAAADRFAIVAAAQNVSAVTLLDAADRLHAHPGHGDVRLPVHGTDSFALSLVSQALGIRGEGAVAGGAQASGHVAIAQAARLLRGGDADAVLVLGVPVRLAAVEIEAWRALGALGGASLPFDARSEGFLPAETAGALVLERADAAQGRGACVLAELAAVRVALHGSTLPTPDAAAAARVMAAALDAAAVSSREVALVSAHATGTAAGDAAEAEAIAAVLGGRITVNAPKGLLGHALVAAGVVETVACVVQMRDGFVHGNPWLEAPRHPGLAYAGADAAAVRPDVVLKTGFGFGGFNAALVLKGAGRHA